MPTSKAVDTSPAPDYEPVVSHLIADISDIVDDTREVGAEGNKKNAEFIQFKLSNLDVKASKEPYTLPAFIVEIRYIRMPHSQWDVMAESIRKCGYEGDINGLILKRAEFKYTEGMLNLPKQVTDPETGVTSTIRGEYEVRKGNCWQIVNIDGVSNNSNQLQDKIVEMADGQTADGFKSIFMSDLTLQTMSGYQEAAVQIMNNTHLDLLVGLGALTKDAAGIYHKA